jgi:hypothetical protein
LVRFRWVFVVTEVVGVFVRFRAPLHSEYYTLFCSQTPQFDCCDSRVAVSYALLSFVSRIFKIKTKQRLFRLKWHPQPTPGFTLLSYRIHFYNTTILHYPYAARLKQPSAVRMYHSVYAYAPPRTVELLLILLCVEKRI